MGHEHILAHEKSERACMRRPHFDDRGQIDSLPAFHSFEGRVHTRANWPDQEVSALAADKILNENVEAPSGGRIERWVGKIRWT